MIKFLTFLLFIAGCGAVMAAPEKPNFIVITADDLGYADIGPFGSTRNRTPELDRMAQEGRLLTSFYAAPVCSPSRAALMTGSYAKRALPIPHVLFPVDPIGLAPEEVTVAEVLKEAGYATAIIGKWHLGDQPAFLPNAQGYDLHFGLPYSNDMGPPSDGVRSDLGKPIPQPRAQGKSRGQPPLPLLRNGTVVKRVLPDDQQSLVEIYTEEAVQYITAKKDQPFLLYMPHNAVHFPIYPGKKWAGKSPNGIYSDWVEELDWSVGQILQAVRKNGLAERTLVLFTSDNGGTPRGLNTPLRGHKGSTLEGGIRVPTLAWWPGKVPPASTTNAITGMHDILPTLTALAGAKLPTGRKLDGVDITPQLTGNASAPPAHQTFFYYNGLRLNAVRRGDWKLQVAMGNAAKSGDPEFQPQLYHLIKDPGESTNVAAENPDIVKELQSLIDGMKDDLSLDGIGPGCRPLGRVANPQPIIAHDAKPTPTDAANEWAMQVDEKLPHVLLIGDSISIGYTRDVRKALQGRANVFRPMLPNGKGPDNCGDTTIGLINLDRWLADRKWSVIHFNWGLWDLCYRNPAVKGTNNRDKVNGKISTPPEDYERQLEELVSRLKATGATLIWASTTHVPEGEEGRFPGDDAKYNTIAARVMARHGIATNDLHGLTSGFAPSLFVKPGDVHYTPEGYQKIASQVAGKITAALPASP